jgi:acyl-CoA synthetase (AMP-forming)/AMP-acid ligase II
MVNKNRSTPNLSNVYELLLHQARIFPGKIAYRFLDEKFNTRSLNYRELDNRAKAIAASLQTFTSPGDRILLLYPPGIDFITAFFGCLYAGVISIPLDPPTRACLEQNIPVLEFIINDAEPALILTNNEFLSLADFIFLNSTDLRCLQWYATDNDVRTSNAG